MRRASSGQPNGRASVSDGAGARRLACAAQGFTLLETLIALSVLGLLLSAVYGSYRAVTSSITALEPKLALDQEGRFLLQRLSRQIRCCYGGPAERAKRPAADPKKAEPAALGQPDEAQETHYFRGGSVLSDGVLLQFVTTNSRLSRKSSPGCLALVSYRLDTGRQALLVSEELYGRRGMNDDKEWHVVQEGLAAIEFRYFDGTAWQDEWDSRAAGALPRAVRIALVLQPEPGGDSRCFTAVVPIRCGAPRKVGDEVSELSISDKKPEDPLGEKERKK